MDQHPLLRTRTNWFAPWTWKWRKREIWGLIGVTLVLYVLSPGVVQYALERFRVYRGHPISRSIDVVLYPPRTLAKTWPYLATIHAEEREWLYDLCGSPKIPEPPARYILRREGFEGRGYGSRGFSDQHNGRLTALTDDGDLIVNDKAYGRIPKGSSIVIEKDGRVLVDGIESIPDDE